MLSLCWQAVGSVTLPINKVVGAQLEVTTQTVRAARCGPGRSSDTVVTFSASTTFASLPVEGRARDFVPGTPQLIPELPPDFFYPFSFGDNSQAATG